MLPFESRGNIVISTDDIVMCTIIAAQNLTFSECMFFLHAEDSNPKCNFSYTEKKYFPSQNTHARSLVYRIYQHSIIPRYPQ